MSIYTPQALEHDVEAFVSEVQRLEKIARQLVSLGHFDITNINARQVQIILQYLCMYVCIYIHMYMPKYVYTYLHLHAFPCACTYMHTYKDI